MVECVRLQPCQNGPLKRVAGRQKISGNRASSKQITHRSIRPPVFQPISSVLAVSFAHRLQGTLLIVLSVIFIICNLPIRRWLSTRCTAIHLVFRLSNFLIFGCFVMLQTSASYTWRPLYSVVSTRYAFPASYVFHSGVSTC